MYTRCPACKTAYRVSVSQLRDGRGEVRCEHCQTVFDALPTLAMTAHGASQEAPPPPEAPVLTHEETLVVPPGLEKRRPFRVETESTRIETPAVAPPEPRSALRGEPRPVASTPRPRRAEPASAPAADEPEEEATLSVSRILLYGVGSLVFAILLIFQILAFEYRGLAQNAQVRPLLEALCGPVDCDLPPFRDLRRILIKDRALNPADGSRPGLEFSMLFVNESDLPQSYPRLKLMLNDVRGQTVAERVFDPAEYVHDWTEGALMPPEKPVEIHLQLARPSKDVAGFTLELL